MANLSYKTKPSVVQVNRVLFYNEGHEFDHKDEARAKAKAIAKEQEKRYVIADYSDMFRKRKYVVMLAPK